MENYTPEQIADIKDREAKGLQALKDLQLTPCAAIQKESLGNDVFGDRVIPFLKDTKYQAVISPIQDVNPETSV